MKDMLVTASKDGEIFFFEVNGAADLNLYEPLCMVHLPEGKVINDMKWDFDSTKIIVACESGDVYELRKPEKDAIDRNRETYELFDYPMRHWQMKMMEEAMKKNQKKDEEEEEKKRRLKLRGLLVDDEDEEEENWDPDAITSISYVLEKPDCFIVGSKGQYAGYYYLCQFGQERPLKRFPIPKESLLTYVDFNAQSGLFILGLSNGEIRVSFGDDYNKYMKVKDHDGHGGSITSAKLSFDKKYLISTGHDGLLIIHQIDTGMIKQEARY